MRLLFPSDSSRRALAVKSTVAAALLVCGAAQAQPSPDTAVDALACISIQNDGARLACYDSRFQRPERPAEQANGKAAAPPIMEAKAAAIDNPAKPVPQDASVLSQFWELGEADKRGTFKVRTYLPNYLLPVHFSNHVRNNPSSPTQPAPSGTLTDYSRVEAKFQISLRTKVVQDLLLPDADLWFAYTQKSLWQIWNRGESAPFRATDYEPEVMYVVPVPERYSHLPLDWRWRMVDAGFVHQSNGQTNPLSRSWNRVYLGTAFENKSFTVDARAEKRLRERDTDDNPDITDYLGRGQLRVTWLPGRAVSSLQWRTSLNKLERGSLQWDWTYPVMRDKPDGLRWYVQVFHGHGESLLDYNNRLTSFGAGISLMEF